MAEVTKIQWTTATFNPWIGCTKISGGCTNCYAEVEQFARVKRSAGIELWGPKGERHVTSESYWRKPVAWNNQAAAEGQRRRVFCASLCDVFEDRRDLDAPRARLWELIEATPWLDWQLLTKRPELMPALTPRTWAARWPDHVWALTSVEDQPNALRRIAELVKVPACIRGLSIEPLLGAVDLVAALAAAEARADVQEAIERHPDAAGGQHLHWAIVGGESGRCPRPCHVEHVRSLVHQCRSMGIAPFVKQLGAVVILPTVDAGAGFFEVGALEERQRAEWPPPVSFGNRTARQEFNGRQVLLRDPKGGDLAEWPPDLRVREFPRGM